MSTNSDYVTFSVEAIGTGLTYQWEYSDDGGFTWQNSPAPGNTTPILTVPTTADRNDLKYRCVVSNANGQTISSVAVFNIVETSGPIITRQPVSRTIIIESEN